MIYKLSEFDILKKENNRYYINNIYVISNEYIQYICSRCGIEVIKIIKEYKNNLCFKCSRKQTKLEKYDNENYVNSIKARQTLKKKYGVENISQLKEIKEKKKITMMKNHGTWKSFELFSSRNTIKERYGVENISQSDEIKKKKKNSCFKKYNDINYNNRKKYKKTMALKYKVENSFQIKDIINATRNNLILLGWKNILKNKNIEPLFTLEEYLNKEGKYDKFKWKCQNCGGEFEDYYANGRTPRCLFCYPIVSGFSSQEKEIVDYCKSLGLEVIENDRLVIKPYEIDIYIPSHKLGIEYNGLYYHSTKFKNKYYHQNKIKLAREKGVRLLHIWENEWIKDQDTVKSKIQYYIDNLQKEILSKEPELYEIQGNSIWI